MKKERSKRAILFSIIVLIWMMGCNTTKSDNRYEESTQSESRLDVYAESETQTDILAETWTEPEILTDASSGNQVESKATPVSQSDAYAESEMQAESKQPQAGDLKVHFIDVGQGDSTLVECDGHFMLIDAGNNSKGTTVQLYLTKQGVDSLDYVIATHPDADHIGGLDVILYKYPCETIFMTDVKADSKSYDEVLATLENKGYSYSFPGVGSEFPLGSAKFTIVSPAERYEETNEDSIGILLENGAHRFLFVGDAEANAEADMINGDVDIAVDVLKVGHHGSYSSTSEAFLQAVNPKYAVISCGQGNTYGHPHEELLERLKSRNISVFRTDEQGSIVISSDGERLSFSAEPSLTWLAGVMLPSPEEVPQDRVIPVIPEEEPKKELPAEQPGVTVTYIANLHTKKFHYPTCSSVKDMAEKNKWAVDCSRQELIDQHYDPCKRCNP